MVSPARLIWLSSFDLVYSLWKWDRPLSLSSRALTHALLSPTLSLSLSAGARSPPPPHRTKDLSIPLHVYSNSIY